MQIPSLEEEVDDDELKAVPNRSSFLVGTYYGNLYRFSQ